MQGNTDFAECFRFYCIGGPLDRQTVYFSSPFNGFHVLTDDAEVTIEYRLIEHACWPGENRSQEHVLACYVSADIPADQVSRHPSAVRVASILKQLPHDLGPQGVFWLALGLADAWDEFRQKLVDVARNNRMLCRLEKRT